MGIGPSANDAGSSGEHAQSEELARLQAELKDYQDLIEELPQIYESKFNHQLRDVAREIRGLMIERHQLHQQISAFLPGGVDPPNPSPGGIATRSRPMASLRGWLRRPSSRPWALVAACAGVVLLLPTVLMLRAVHRPADSSPAPAIASDPPRTAPDATPRDVQAPSPAPQLRIRATGEAWLEVRNPDQTLVFEGTMQPGQELSYLLRDGMRIRSGRPHLLQIALAQQPFAPLGAANDYRWRSLGIPR